jgi:hypothetical protein
MKKLFMFCAVTLILIAPLLTGCSAIFHTSGSSQLIEKTFDFKDFNSVNISGAIQYDVEQADNYSVVVSLHEDMLERLDIRQTGNTLTIGMKYVPFSTPNVKVTISMPQLSRLEVLGACDGKAAGFDSNNALDIRLFSASEMDTNIKAGVTTIFLSGASRINGNLTSTDTEIKLSGASEMNMILQTGNTVINESGSSQIRGALKAQDCQFTLSGASSCDLTGSAGDTSIIASGSSEMNSPGFTMQTADVKLTAASDASIGVVTALDVDISGASSLTYTGKPAFGKIAVSEASELNHK